jgi:hypothetical protein
VLAGSWRLSTAAILIGLANGILYALHGSYTRTLDRTARWLTETQGWPFGLEWGLFAAVLAGAALSACQRRSFRLTWRPSGTWALDFAGGLLMGIGAALVPGGNDVLVLHALRSCRLILCRRTCR